MVSTLNSEAVGCSLMNGSCNTECYTGFSFRLQSSPCYTLGELHREDTQAVGCEQNNIRESPGDSSGAKPSSPSHQINLSDLDSHRGSRWGRRRRWGAEEEEEERGRQKIAIKAGQRVFLSLSIPTTLRA